MKGMERLHLTRELIGQVGTPFYLYDMTLLRHTLEHIKRQVAGWPYRVHYAVKANGNPRILNEIARLGLGADLVSGGELIAALQAGFAPGMMNFSGVGKTDREIMAGLEHGIGMFNVESVPELQVIDQLAVAMGKVARIAIRVNPDIDAHTHRNITTAKADNKFGIDIDMLPSVLAMARQLPGVHLAGLHFHLGSQLTDMTPYLMLCDVANRLNSECQCSGITLDTINVGGGLGIDYDKPDEHPVPDFGKYFDTFKQHLRLLPHQELHFELGRSIVGQCGSLVASVVFVKQGRNKQFVILDAGMTDLIRPALYDAHHVIQNLSAPEGEEVERYDIVGPVCESTDVFAHDCPLPVTRRGDIIAIRSAGAYGQSMASTYNMRALPGCAYVG